MERLWGLLLLLFILMQFLIEDVSSVMNFRYFISHLVLETQHQKSLKSNVIKISFTQMALELNSSREVISRLMKKLADTGQIKLGKNQVEIIHLPI